MTQLSCSEGKRIRIPRSPVAAAINAVRSGVGEASPLRTIWTASKRRRLKRRSTALRAQTYAGRATATAASVARIVSHCDEGRTIGMLRVVTTTTRPKTAITAAELSAYAAESLTTRSTSYRRYLTTASAAPSTRVTMHGVRIQPAQSS